MRIKSTACLFGFALSVALSLHAQDDPEHAPGPDGVLLDGIAAQVNDHVVTVGEVTAAVGPSRQRIAAEARTEEAYREQLKRAYAAELNAAIERKLILDAFAAEEGAIPEWAIERRQEDIVRQQFGDDFSRLQDALRNDGMTMEQWRDIVRERMIIESMRSAKVNSAIRVNPIEVRRLYDTYPEQFRTPARTRISMIVIEKRDPTQTPERKALAHSVHERILQGESFQELAREVSDDSTAEAGGDWGWIDPKQLRTELARVVDALPARGISEIIETEQDFYILEVTEKQPASETPFKDVAQKIEHRLRVEQGEQIYRAWLQELRDGAFIKIFDVQAF